MNTLKIKFKADFATGFCQLVDSLVKQTGDDDDEKLIMAALAEVKMNMQKKLLVPQEKYSVKLSAVQAIAMRILYNDYVQDPTSFMGCHLLSISNSVNQKFQ